MLGTPIDQERENFVLVKKMYFSKQILSPKPPEASGHGSIRQLAERERAEDKQADSLGQRSGLRERICLD